MDAPALQARDLYRFFRTGDDETLALRGVSLSVDRGETVAVIGPSGCLPLVGRGLKQRPRAM